MANRRRNSATPAARPTAERRPATGPGRRLPRNAASSKPDQTADRPPVSDVERSHPPRTAQGPVVVIAAALMGVIAFLVYLRTLHPSLPPGDSGELISAAYAGGVVHPPGYPLYTMLGHLATLLPFGSPAADMNLLSAFLDASAVGLVFILIWRLCAGPERTRSWAPLVAAAVGSLLLAFSTTFWSYSLVAEVFALNNLFAVSLLLVATEWARRPDRTGLLWLFALVFGMSLSNQQTIVLFVPAFTILLWSGWRRLHLPASGSATLLGGPGIRALVVAIGMFVVGLLPYAYLPIAAAGDPPLNWLDPRTLDRFVALLTRASYGTFTLAVQNQSGSIVEQLGLLAGSLLGAFTPFGLLLAAAGVWWLARHRSSEGIALVAAFLVAGPLFVAYANVYISSPLAKGILERFYILPAVPLAVVVGLGANQVLAWVREVRVPRGLGPRLAPLAAALLLLVLIGTAVAHQADVDQSGNYVTLHYGEDLLAPLEPNALLLSEGDLNYTSVTYKQVVDRDRTDVVLVDTQLLKAPWYVDELRRKHPDVVIPFDAYDGGKTTTLASVVAANIGRRPVYEVGLTDQELAPSDFDQLRVGFARQLLPRGQAPDPYALLRQDSELFVGFRYPDRSFPDTSWEAFIAPSYGSVAFDVAYALDSANPPGDPAIIERMYRLTIRLEPNESSAYKDLGLLLYGQKRDPTDVAALWGRYLVLAPNDPDAVAIRKALASLPIAGPSPAP